jgi:peptidoglycan/LPS O-acetylase OafA/YrhL
VTASPSTPPDTSTSRVAAPAARIRALDGLRGITIVLVMLNHASNNALWARAALDDVPVLRSLAAGGSVTLFFVVGAFIVTRNLLREREDGDLDAVLFLGRRVVRLWTHLVPLAVVLFLWQWFDPHFLYDTETTVASLVAALTFTVNLMPVDEMRGDVATLWYLGVQQQWYLVLPLILLVLGRWRVALVAAVAVLFAASTWWRFQVLHHTGWVEASVGTFSRADGLLLGVLLAAALPWLARRTGWVRWCLPLSALVAFALLATLHEFHDQFLYLRWWGTAYTLVCGVLVVTVFLAPAGAFTMRALAVRPLAVTGRASLALYVWHMPVILAVQLYLADQPWYVGTAVAVAALVAIAWFSERYLDGPVRVWLRTHLRPAGRVPA